MESSIVPLAHVDSFKAAVTTCLARIEVLRGHLQYFHVDIYGWTLKPAPEGHWK